MDVRLDGIEVKVTIGAEQVEVARQAFALSGDDGRRRRIYFCEDVAAGGSAALPLLDNGIILRLRQNKGGKDDSTVKLRPFDRTRLTPRWLHARKHDGWEFKVEGDWVGDRHVVAASWSPTRTRSQRSAVRKRCRAGPSRPNRSSSCRTARRCG
jgi:hypothetical protein